jgi:NAD(P)-dependent dehydrogenase (short-subunit alcohol dehydrogenase family)
VTELRLAGEVAVDAASFGVRCNAVAPGYVLHEQRDRDLLPERREELEAQQLLPLTTAGDVATWARHCAGTAR